MQTTYPYNINYNISVVYVYNDNNSNTDNNTTAVPDTDNRAVSLNLSDIHDGYIDINGNNIDIDEDTVITSETQNNVQDEPAQTKQYAVEYDIENKVNEYSTEERVSVIGLINEKAETESDIEDSVKDYATVVHRISKVNKPDTIDNAHTETLSDFNMPLAVCGQDWFVSEKLYSSWFRNVLNNSDIPEDKHYLYYIADSNIVKDIKQMSYDILYNKDIKHFWKLNIIDSKKSKNKFTEDELSNFSQTFFKLLDQYTNYKYTPAISSRIVGVYNKLINYYINNKYDETMADIDLMLNTSINATTVSLQSSSSTCGCSSSSSSNSNNIDNSTSIQSCYDIYKNSFSTLTKEMFSDITNFYNNYFYDIRIDDNGKKCLYSNEDLCNILLLYIDEYLATYPNIDTNTETDNFSSDKLYCSCDKNENTIKSVCDYNVINDFKKLLQIIKYTSIQGNENKVQYWGKKFGELIAGL